MTVRPLSAQITETGLDQRNLVKLLRNLVDTVNELVDDHATQRTVSADNKTLVNNLRLNLIALYEKMDADFADVINASTDYAAVLGSGGSDEDALAAAVGTSPPATLSDTTDLTLEKS